MTEVQSAAASTGPTIESVLQEQRVFDPPAALAASARIGSLEAYWALAARAEADPDAFWDEQAREHLHWFEPFHTVLDWSNPPFARWFEGGRTNLSFNCLDRHLDGPRADKTALIWEGEPGDTRTFTYRQLHAEVCKAANALKALGIGKGDLVALYMPMVPEAAIAMLACARIGAPHSVVFGGFSADALRDRLIDGEVKAVITADGGFRKDKPVPLKPAVDEALGANGGAPSVQAVLVVQRLAGAGGTCVMQANRDHWWHDLVDGQSADCAAEPMESEDRLFVLYTSGSTGKPKGVVHTTAGYNLWAHLTFQWIFDIREDDIHWCTADVGWITGHSYIVYGPLSNGATTVMYEGAPRPSNPGAFWEVIQKHKVSIFYTAPTAIRAFMKSGRAVPDQYDMSSVRILGTVGEPINPEAWMWYRDVIGGGRCPIVDTWWQTETGGVMISPLPGATPTKPGSATLPLPGIAADVVDHDGNSQAADQGGYLAVRRPWPGMMRTVHGDPERFRKSYWEEIKPSDGSWLYFAGDGARRDADGYFWVMGRVDDVINVSGHRLGTMEIESALVSHPAVAEAAVVGRPDDLKGEGIVAFVTLEAGRSGDDALLAELRSHVGKEIGPIAKPDVIKFTDALPKTRSGKIMRRILRSLAAGQEVSGDTSTLEDRSVLDALRV
ncbi:acetate--CoA ligase [Synechococcus sp. HJ21-Hayes]|uniref:acetate--CoA ligase n=1 Tax=unclassified Synechococcus TaxID=2626047 RepID=UPI0020CF77FC|nr:MULTISPECIES: acetate--CoA ligase [unclassified Synechococcus]MCP9830801.1 acetate--CoA ligase [Synechococcus sp. JJ3a-Johnson]MCP9851971.1 acetate--CoA ligase [Synechococcus sp. HJ21-Hayes]